MLIPRAMAATSKPFHPYNPAILNNDSALKTNKQTNKLNFSWRAVLE